MKFIVDAHLPLGVCDLLKRAGHDAIHTRNLPLANKTPDRDIAAIAEKESRVVISKDNDFYYSHVLHRRPRQLVIVRAGNLRLRDVVALFAKHLPEIESALKTDSLIELHRTHVLRHHQ